MNSLKKMVPSLLFVLLTMLGWFSDFLTQTYGIAFVYVESSYLGNVFAATCTVAVLGNAILSLLVGAHERKILGIPFQIVLSRTSVGTYLLQAIIVPLLSIIPAIVAFAYELYASLTILLVYNVGMIVSASVVIWSMLSVSRKQEMLIREIIHSSSANECASYIDNWFAELHRSIIIKDQNGIQQYMGWIKTVSKNIAEKEPIAQCIENQLPETFLKTCESYGFLHGYELVSEINGTRKYGYVDLERIALDYIRKIRYSEACQIAIRDMSTTVENIVTSNRIEHDIKRIIIYNLFCAVHDNTYITLDEKRERIGSLLTYLCCLRDGYNEDIKVDILLNIFKNKVLLEDDINKRQWLHLLLVEQLLQRNRINHDNCYIRTVAEMFRALFFFVNYETETLTEKYRKDLQKLYSLTKEEKDLVRVSFSTLVEENKPYIVSWLAADSVIFDWRKSIRWDYFPALSSAKSIIWDASITIRFAYCYYKWVGYSRTGHPFASIIQSDEFDDDEKENVCREITNLFSRDGLSHDAVQTIEQLENLTGMKNRHDSYYDSGEQSFFQDELIKLINSQNRSELHKSESTNEGIITLVQNVLKDYKCLQANQHGGGNRYTRRRLPPTMVEMSKNYLASSAYRIAHITQQIINDVVARKLSQVQVGFDLDGINAMLHNLESSDYKYRNYTYINDLAFKTDIINTEEYKRLKEQIEAIPKDDKSAFSSYIFLKVPHIEYALDIHYHLVEPTDMQCEEYVRAHEIADGYYQINGNKFDFAHAVRYVRTEFMLEICDLYVLVGVESKMGFKINFIRK